MRHAFLVWRVIPIVWLALGWCAPYAGSQAVLSIQQAILGEPDQKTPEISTAELRQIFAEQSATVFDARPFNEYAVSHIPGAVNRPYTDNIAGDGRFKPVAELRNEFAALIGSRAPSAVVHTCGSGVTACHNLLAMEHAGLGGTRLYAGSWSEWSADPSRPIARGDS